MDDLTPETLRHLLEMESFVFIGAHKLQPRLKEYALAWETQVASLTARLERLEAENKALRGNTSKSVLRRLEQCGILAAEEVKP